MGKFFLRFFLLLLITTISLLIYLSYFGIETDKFDDLIKNKTDEVSRYIKLGFPITKIYIISFWQLFSPHYIILKKLNNMANYIITVYRESRYFITLWECIIFY